jgi:aminoglycoside phosphotransferase (APT) family kinase protein
VTTDTHADLRHAAASACRSVGLPADRIHVVHRHASAVFVVPEVPAVVRLSPAAITECLRTAVALTRWLDGHGLAVTRPLPVDQPVVAGDTAATFWAYYPQGDRALPSARHLGVLLRELHTIPEPPPVPLPEYRPLDDLGRTLAHTRMDSDDRAWLQDRRSRLLDAYDRLDLPLGHGLLHGDAYPGNTLWDGDDEGTVRLGDWDEAARGPRVLDLANTVHGHRRFGRPRTEVDAFAAAYGYDIRDWDGLPTLLDIRDLHTLGAFIRRADDGDEAARRHLAHRMATLRRGEVLASWVM